MEDTFFEVLQKNSLSKTKPRLVVFKALVISQRALSMNELVDLCESINRVTVYRIVDQFEKIGIVHKVQIGWKYKIELGDVFKEHHHHLTCIQCGATVDVEEPRELHSFIERVARDYSFDITQHTLELRGVCVGCAHKT